MDKNFPAIAYHEDGTHVVVASAEHQKKLGSGYSDKPNDKTLRALRKASGAAKTDPMPGVISTPSTTEAY